uniref:hypothetical protein n=1 Tax=Mycolicibacterium mucogenicum TaxID=56689 RepID=UPI000A9215B6
ASSRVTTNPVSTTWGQGPSDLIAITEANEVDATALLAKVSTNVVPDSVAAFTAAYDTLGIVNPDKRKFATGESPILSPPGISLDFSW